MRGNLQQTEFYRSRSHRQVSGEINTHWWEREKLPHTVQVQGYNHDHKTARLASPHWRCYTRFTQQRLFYGVPPDELLQSRSPSLPWQTPPPSQIYLQSFTKARMRDESRWYSSDIWWQSSWAILAWADVDGTENTRPHFQRTESREVRGFWGTCGICKQCVNVYRHKLTLILNYPTLCIQALQQEQSLILSKALDK